MIKIRTNNINDYRPVKSHLVKLNEYCITIKTQVYVHNLCPILQHSSILPPHVDSLKAT